MYKLKIGSELQDMLAELPSAEQTKLGNFLLANANEHIVQSFLNDNISADERPNYLNPSIEDSGKLSWTTNKKIQLYSFDNDEQIYINTDRRIRAKVGRTINKIFCSSFLEHLGVDNHDLDKFVRQLKCYKPVNDDVNSDENFEETTNFEYYSEGFTSTEAREGSGSLGESCMRHSNCIEDNFFEIYEDNNVKLLIHKDDYGDIDARALLWTLDDGRVIMDRIYTDYDYKEDLFKSYASRHGYWYKKRQSYSHKTTFINKEGKEVYDEGLFFKLRHGRCYDNVPYLDTFSYSFEHEDDYYLTNCPKAAYEEFGAIDFFYYESVDGYYSNHSIEVGVTYNPETDEITSGILDSNHQVICFEIDDSGDKHTPKIEKSSKLHDIAKNSLDYIYNESDNLNAFSISNNREFLINIDGDKIVWGIVNDDEQDCRKNFLQSEGFVCDYSGSTYYKASFKQVEVDGRLYREIDTIQTFSGKTIHKNNARVVFFDGKAKVVDHTVNAVRTLDGLFRPESECVHISINDQWNWYSKTVHAREIRMAEKLNEATLKYRGSEATQIPTVHELVSGKHDNRRTY